VSHGVVSSQEFQLPPGRYEVRVTNASFRDYVRKVTVHTRAASDLTVDLQEMGVAVPTPQKGVPSTP
jgi:hypothetical protein